MVILAGDWRIQTIGQHFRRIGVNLSFLDGHHLIPVFRAMKKIFTHFISFAGGVVVCLLFFVLPCLSPNSFFLRENGTSWFSFGPGIISGSSCERIDVAFASFSDVVTITDPAKILIIKQWILDNQLDRRFRFSPTIPFDFGNAGMPRYAIYLSSSSDLNDPNALIIGIPINTLTLGVDQKACEVKMAELRKLVKGSAP